MMMRPSDTELTGDWSARRWSAVRAVLATIGVLSVAAAIFLHPAVGARYLSVDGELTESSRRSLYIVQVALISLALAVMFVWRRWQVCTPGRERITLGVGMLFGSLLVSVLVSEAGLIAVHRFKPLGTERHYFLVYDPVLGWKHRPGSTATYKKSLVRIDEDGFRISGGERGPVTSRMLLVGDSQAFGDGVAAEDTFAAYLESDIPGLQVLNASVIGYATDQQLLYFENRGRAYAPAVTLVSLNAYDLRENLRSNVRNGYEKPRFVLTSEGLRLMNVPVPGDGPLDRVDRSLQQHSHVYRLVRGLSRASREPRDPRERRVDKGRDRVPMARRLADQVYPSGDQFEESLSVTASILERFAADARQVGTRLIVLFLPYQMDFGGSDGYTQHTDRLLQVLQNRAASGMFTMIDGRAAIAGDDARSLYMDGLHLTPEGHRRVAALLARTLTSNQLISRKHAN
jgi:hypothetical protein